MIAVKPEEMLYTESKTWTRLQMCEICQQYKET